MTIMRLSHRIAAATAALPLLLTGAVLAAPTAQAAPSAAGSTPLAPYTTSDCYSYLSGLGYGGIYSSLGCVAGATALPLAYETCYELLFLQGIPVTISDEACRRAAL
ncbi:hypothetical protein NBG84_38425 [Streptomyces sp. CWNU-1]|uniref:Secreted protein n=2 Tax=Streptomyces albipurpureus TaxID=2897419 RepID=A0ABT0V044_9ACTN|nr:hypothetical protein [Streptomyces sp. CWNU-1]